MDSGAVGSGSKASGATLSACVQGNAVSVGFGKIQSCLRCSCNSSGLQPTSDGLHPSSHGLQSQRNGLQLKSDVFIPLCCTHGTPPCPKISSCMVGCMVKSSAQWALEMSEHVDHHCALSVVVFISFWLLCFLFRPLGLNFRPCADPSFIQLASPCLLFSCIPSTKWPTT